MLIHQAGHANTTSHICVCICTFKRPHLLEGLLSRLQTQRTAGLFTYSVLVVDNDYQQRPDT